MSNPFGEPDETVIPVDVSEFEVPDDHLTATVASDRMAIVAVKATIDAAESRADLAAAHEMYAAVWTDEMATYANAKHFDETGA